MCENNIGQIISVHNFLTVIFNEISGLDKRSLASKYLHFHLPNLFYIYDSRADNAIRKMVKTIRLFLNLDKGTYHMNTTKHTLTFSSKHIFWISILKAKLVTD